MTGQADRPVAGSARVRALVEECSGRLVLLGPLGPRRALDPGDRRAVVALLRQRTRVLEQRE
ncbi:hypothetical protein [Streptomyces sp. NPDC085665]|uniref:hypothetical protein n=1 Tax=Streptomyces sp. NPDC085665 TaxID=3365735 RepID=UPI0037D2C9F7